MFRLIAAIVLTVSAVVFVMANTHHVELSVVVGSPIRVRMIFLLMVTFGAGLITAGLWGMLSRMRWKRRIVEQLRQERSAAKAAAE